MGVKQYICFKLARSLPLNHWMTAAKAAELLRCSKPFAYELLAGLVKAKKAVMVDTSAKKADETVRYYFALLKKVEISGPMRKMERKRTSPA